MKQKINIRLSLIAFIAVIFSAVSITLVYYNLFQNQVRADLQINARIISDCRIFQRSHEAAGGDAEKTDIPAMNSLDGKTLRVTWIDEDGTVLYDNDNDISSMPNHLDRPEVRDAIETGAGESIRRSDTMNLSTFNYALKMDDGTILRVSTRARSLTSIIFTALPVIALISLVIAGICIMIGHYLTEQLLKPINMMAEQLDDNISTPVYKELQPFANKIRSQHEKILEAASGRQDFTANVSHELKTPLTAISGYAELIENKMIDPEQEAYIARQIRNNAERLLSLINDIIRLSELDHKETERRFVSVDVFSSAMEMCKNIRMMANRKNVSVVCTGESADISGDPDLIAELIDNLLQNAVRYNRDGGYVRVDVRRENGHAVLSVEDNGIGIPEDKQSHVFERFYRVDKSRSRETGGTGLGLAIVKHIAEIHNAQIKLQSTVGKGTVVSVIF
ncbi:MAG: ATP-binding protein [Clostridiales bacterium]|nr:ATP-binding protein [Clostridiales bacterium]